MEIKQLTLAEMPQAVKLARGVFDFCLRKSMISQECIQQFDTYTNETNIRMMMGNGCLTLWGVYEVGQLVAMSGMQREGHITMLYVLPVYQRRGYGKELLLTMRKYAGSQYQLPSVTVMAMPAWTASYFQRRKFVLMNPVQVNLAPYVYLQAKSIREVSYEIKKLPAGAVLGTVLGGVGVCMAAAVLYMASIW